MSPHAHASTNRRKLELVLLSDVHLGSRTARAAELLNYLGSIAPETLVINGDLLELDRFRKRGLPEAHLDVVRALLELSSSGTRIYYLIGNAEEKLRRFSGLALGNLHLREELELRVGGQRYWMFHGDRFDPVIRLGPALADLGGPLYRLLVRLDGWTGRLRRGLGLGQFSLADLLRHSGAYENRYRELFETSAIELAAHRGFAYVACGHSHRPAIRQETVRGKSITYLNAGDWVEHLTSLEFQFGRWRFYQYEAQDFPKPNARLRVDAGDKRPRLRTPLAPAEHALLKQIVANKGG